MDLKIRQAMVQSAGTINGFNYAYCKTLHENALKLLKTDFVYGDGKPFLINKSALEEFKKKDEEVKKLINEFDFSEADEQKKNEFHIASSGNIISLKENSLLPILVDRISEQLNIGQISNLSGSYVAPGDVEELIDKVTFYFDIVKRYLAMFE